VACRPDAVVPAERSIIMSEEHESDGRGVLDAANEAYLAVDEEWRLLEVSDAAVRLLECPAPESTGRSLWQAFAGLEGSPFEDPLREAMADGDAVSETAHVAAHDAWFELRAYPDGEGLSVYLRDVTERKRREDHREATLGSLRELYDVTTDAELRFEEKVDRTLDLGCERLELPYGFLSRIETGEASDGRQAIVTSRGDHPLLQPGESCPLSWAYCRRTLDTDGLLAIQDAVAAGWADDAAYETFEFGSYIGGKVLVEGDLYGTLCFASTEPREVPFGDADRMLVRVMSKWVSYELERRRRTAELERTNRRLERFVSVVSHDLRNPLTVASGRLELAREADDSEDLAAASAALDRMSSLIEDSLTLAREHGEATDLEDVDLAATCEECLETVDTTDAEAVVEASGAIRADPGRLKQLLENLFRNAVEHGSTSSRPAADDAADRGPGGVKITVGDLPNGFYVEDNGPGIPAEDREAVFESGVTSSESGTGFGLAIVEEIAAAHGWDVTATEGTAGGARFEITGVERPRKHT